MQTLEKIVTIPADTTEEVLKTDRERRQALFRLQVALRAGYLILVQQVRQAPWKLLMSEGTCNGINYWMRRCADLVTLALAGHSVSKEEGNFALDKVLETLVDVKFEAQNEASVGLVPCHAQLDYIEWLETVDDLHEEVKKAHALALAPRRRPPKTRRTTRAPSCRARARVCVCPVRGRRARRSRRVVAWARRRAVGDGRGSWSAVRVCKV